MKRDELLAKGFTQEQVTDILNVYHTYDKEKDDQIKALAGEVTTGQTQNAELQRQIDEINRAKMSEQEKLELDKKETKQKLEEAQKIYNTAKAKEILAGLDVPDTLLSRLVTSDENETITNANTYKTQFETYKEKIEKTTKESIQNMAVKPKPSNIPPNDDVVTLDKYNTMTLTDKIRWKKENPESYDVLMGKN